jgi:hypothetical protein
MLQPVVETVVNERKKTNVTLIRVRYNQTITVTRLNYPSRWGRDAEE